MKVNKGESRVNLQESGKKTRENRPNSPNAATLSTRLRELTTISIYVQAQYSTWSNSIATKTTSTSHSSTCFASSSLSSLEQASFHIMKVNSVSFSSRAVCWLQILLVSATPLRIPLIFPHIIRYTVCLNGVNGADSIIV